MRERSKERKRTKERERERGRGTFDVNALCDRDSVLDIYRPELSNQIGNSVLQITMDYLIRNPQVA